MPTLKEIADLIDEDFLRSLPPKEFGKYMAPIAERWIKKKFKEELDVDLEIIKDESLQYDLMSSIDKMRWQIKFRHQTAKTPFGGQLYTHNWRQVNQYKIGNFDCIIFVIYHKNDREDWSICFIPTYKCIDPNNPLYVLKNIPPKLLKEGAEWKTEFNNFKNLFTKEN